MKRLAPLLLLLFWATVSAAQNLHAIVRTDETEVRVLSVSKVKTSYHRKITVLDEPGAQCAGMVCLRSKFSRLLSWRCRLTDAQGETVARLREKDLTTVAVDDAFHSDAQLQYYVPAFTSYPYTVDQEWETESSQTFVLPDWRPQPFAGCRVDSSFYLLQLPADMKLGQLAEAEGGKAAVSTGKDGSLRYRWQLTGLPARSEDSSAPTLLRCTVSPFALGDYEGSMENWKQLGLFMYRLNEGRAHLSPALRAEMQQLTSGLKSSAEKTAAVYRYMQQHTRYLALEYGIGGWQTLDASFVESNRSGDCKALVNYTAALLAATGISSYPVLVTAGVDKSRYTDEQFPSNSFNHVILCVPDAAIGRATWLECTSPSLPAGYLGSFTADRWGLMITPEGGQLVRTPAYGADANYRHSSSTVRLENGTWTAEVSASSSGLLAEGPMGRLETMNAGEKEDWLGHRYRLPSYEISGHRFETCRDCAVPRIRESFRVKANGLETVAGSSLFLPLRPLLLPLPDQVLHTGKDRTGLVLLQSLEVDDSLFLEIPEGYEASVLPAATTLETDLVRFHTECRLEGRRLLFVRRFSQKSGHYAPGSSTELAELKRRLTDDKISRITLRKSSG